jgi:hypothetical protein
VIVRRRSTHRTGNTMRVPFYGNKTPTMFCGTLEKQASPSDKKSCPKRLASAHCAPEAPAKWSLPFRAASPLSTTPSLTQNPPPSCPTRLYANTNSSSHHQFAAGARRWVSPTLVTTAKGDQALVPVLLRHTIRLQLLPPACHSWRISSYALSIAA